MRLPKERALNAAVELLGTEGLRALTHARVDQRSGLPKGSTSNYFRTRDALLAAVVDWIVEREQTAYTGDFSPSSAVELVDVLCAWFDTTTGVNRTLTTARLVLFMEASHNATLRQAIDRGRAALESSVVLGLARLGVPEPQAATNAIVGCFEGLLLHRIARHDDTDPRAAFELVVRSTFA